MAGRAGVGVRVGNSAVGRSGGSVAVGAGCGAAQADMSRPSANPKAGKAKVEDFMLILVSLYGYEIVPQGLSG